MQILLFVRFCHTCLFTSSHEWNECICCGVLFSEDEVECTRVFCVHVVGEDIPHLMMGVGLGRERGGGGGNRVGR